MLNAIWVNKISNQPVTVIADFGYGTDNRRYVKIKGSNTGIPLDELLFLDFDGNYISGLDIFLDHYGNLRLLSEGL